jgi:hypothetical protein
MNTQKSTKKVKKPKKITKAKLAKMERTAKRKALVQWSLDVRSGGKCEVCGRTEFLDAHHILPKERYKEYMTVRENGVCLCKNHHKFSKFSFHRNSVWSTLWLQRTKPDTYKWVIEHAGFDPTDLSNQQKNDIVQGDEAPQVETSTEGSVDLSVTPLGDNDGK